MCSSDLTTLYKILKHIIKVPQTRIELVREYKSRRILSPVRLPVPPLRHAPPSYVLLSQAVAHQVPLALKSLTSVFGMGTGVSSSL